MRRYSAILTLKSAFIMRPPLLVFIISLTLLSVSGLSSVRPDAQLLTLVFGGIEFQKVSGSLDVVSIGKWMLFLGPILLYAGMLSGQELTTMGAYVIPRFQYYKKWWRTKLASLLITCLMYQLIGFGISLCVSTLSGCFPSLNRAMELWLIFSLPLLHFFLISALELTIYALFRSQMVAVLLPLGLEGGTLILGMLNPSISRFMFGTWGMFYRSSLADAVWGFSICSIVTVQICMVVLILFIIPMWLKKKGTASFKGLQ